MKDPTLNRHSKLSTKRGVTLRNRLVVPPMASQTATDGCVMRGGEVTPETLAHYARLAQAGPGLLIVEYTYVHLSGRSEDHQLGISCDKQIDGLAQLSAQIKATGAVAGIQITHAGGKTERRLTGGKFMGPSRIAVPVKDRSLEVPDSMSFADIELWKESFLQGFERAVAAGIDLVEFHAAHGYGLNQWLSPLTNQRSDAYGENLMGRARLLLEIVAAARAAHPQTLISVRIPGQDFLEGGLQVSDSVQLARALEEVGCDFIHVSSGIGGWRRPRDRRGEGYLVAEAAKIQKYLRIPVIGVGGIESGAYIDENLQARNFTLAAVGRAILSDPSAWAAKNMGESEIKSDAGTKRTVAECAEANCI